MKNRILGVLLFFFALTLSAQEDPLKIMSSNIRMATENDGINYWNFRRDWFNEMVKFEDIDVFGAVEEEAQKVNFRLFFIKKMPLKF